jgi:hypothetical protein
MLERELVEKDSLLAARAQDVTRWQLMLSEPQLPPLRP